MYKWIVSWEIGKLGMSVTSLLLKLGLQIQGSTGPNADWDCIIDCGNDYCSQFLKEDKSEDNKSKDNKSEDNE